MQGRVLICIGCNTHNSPSIHDLGSAEEDANNLYSALMDPAIGDYEAGRSGLFLSPTLEQIRSHLAVIAKSTDDISVLTFFFAGHGGIHRGSLYLYTKDADLDALSVSAFSLSDLMRIIADQQIPHTNIVLDACQAGGFLTELGPLLNSEAIGARNTPSISLLAMAASNERAGEDDDGGFGTQALLSCVRGDRVCNTEFPTLDLMEVGREVSKAFEGAAQLPVRWGLNLTGASTLCYNPCFAGTDQSPNDLRPHAEFMATVDAPAPFRAEIWTIYLALKDHWNARTAYDLLDRALDSGGDETAQASFIESLALSFSEQAKTNSDAAVVSEVFAVCALALLKRCAPGSEGDAACQRLLQLSLDWASSQLYALADELNENRFALLSRQGGAFDFYYLPIRISKVMGWASAIALCGKGQAREDAASLVQRLLDSILDRYAMNLIVMSELQAGPLALLGAALTKNADIERLESVLSPYLNSLSQQRGLIAAHSLPQNKIFEYLADRYQGMLEPGSELVGQPSEFIAVCLRLSTLAGLSDVMDEMMADLDHIWLNAYLPESYRAIGDDRLENGTNVTMRIGHEIWRVGEFEAAWPNEAVALPQTETERVAANLASLVFGDRVSWFELAAIEAE